MTAAAFAYSDLLPTGPDETPYRLLTDEGVSHRRHPGRTILQVDPKVLQLLTDEAMHDIAHYLRPATSPSCGGSSTTPRRRATTASSRWTC